MPGENSSGNFHWVHVNAYIANGFSLAGLAAMPPFLCGLATWMPGQRTGLMNK